ncbi:translation initiation factor sui1 protein [Besnoitia besnoiti]|uniref:Translation initiation factor sui1 protein n=1 Tax=Besnoitia besnoiti TaxID=94643 RepID=A0A2A9MB36_BESBE|nr:translation initiation factor sui1 protein [Besnoitia besnoiti]PFH33521.1 translation initiation factor sui1 protein [Besnoitia besnoiti]
MAGNHLEDVTSSSEEEAQPSRRQQRQAQLRQQQENQKGKKKGKNAGKQGEKIESHEDPGAREGASKEAGRPGNATEGEKTEKGELNEHTGDSAWEHDKQAPITGPSPVVYCGVCGGAPDFCEFGARWLECKAWIEAHHAELLPFCVPPSSSKEEKEGGNASGDDEGALAERMQRLDVACEEKKPGDEAEKETKKGGKKKAAKPNIVTIQRQSRAKRKTATVVTGLELFGVKLDKAAKLFSKQYACGASVAKGVPGQPQQIEVQGDVEEEIAELIASTFEIPEDNIQLLPPK